MRAQQGAERYLEAYSFNSRPDEQRSGQPGIIGEILGEIDIDSTTLVLGDNTSMLVKNCCVKL